MKNLFLLVGIVVFAGAVYLSVGNDRLFFTENLAAETKENSVGDWRPRKTLKPFRSQKELDDYFRKLAQRQKDRAGNVANESADKMSAPAAKDEADDSVTNVQHAGVDEGGIVKLHGEYLIILRRGRLFTVAIGDDTLRPVSAVDAFGPDIDPRGTWYDEMLVSGKTIAVIGYSYSRGGTEIGLFDIDRTGGISYRSTYHLRSNDYYSSRNYASRLIGSKLIFYTPQYLWPGSSDPSEQFPALRKWRRGASAKDFRPIVSPARIYRPARETDFSYGLALHTVTVCDLDSAEFDCRATSVIGPAGRVFYVSPNSVYVWTTEWLRRREKWTTDSMIYQMPLDGSAPTALAASGSPVDQFSFLESGDGYLNVLVRSQGRGEAMWSSETTAGDVALLRVPRRRFADGRQRALGSDYRKLPKAEGHTLQNRFVGRYLLYGTGNSWGYAEKADRTNLFAVDWKTGRIREISLRHSIDRIEAMGRDAVVVGTAGDDLYFSPVRLNRDPHLGSGYVRKNAAQGELRSHGFFYKSEDTRSGLLGLPIREGGRPGYEHLYKNSASILFLRNDSLKLSELGALEARPTRRGDNCRASCVDWYGNARPLFIRGRLFALLGYEIVEGALTANGIREKRRRNFSPGGV